MFESNIIPTGFEALYERIARAWGVDTTAYENWGQDGIPAETGQCAVTALLIQELHGGELVRAMVAGDSHYWNRINGVYVDFTRAQFTEFVIEGEEGTRTREYVLSNENTARRFTTLKSRF